MKRNTITTLGELKIGDRFTYQKRTDVWEVMKITTSHVFVNLPVLNGYMHQYDEIKRKATPVRFLRHTIPMPGDECILKDLNYGDVFHFTDDPVNEYRMDQFDVKKSDWLRLCKMVNGTDFKVADETTTVILISKK